MSKTSVTTLTDKQITDTIASLDGLGMDAIEKALTLVESGVGDDPKAWQEELARAITHMDARGPSGALIVAFVPRYRELKEEQERRASKPFTVNT